MDLSGGRRNLKCGCCGKLDTASLVMTNESNEWKKGSEDQAPGYQGKNHE